MERVARAVEIRNEMKSNTLILGNGDVLSQADAENKIAQSGADGIMVGRGLFGNPWFFHPTKRLPIRLTALPTHGVDREKIVVTDTEDKNFEYVTIKERLLAMIEHTKLFEELLSEKNFAIMKKHYKAYANGFFGAAELRSQLMDLNTAAEAEAVVHAFLAQNGQTLDNRW